MGGSDGGTRGFRLGEGAETSEEESKCKSALDGLQKTGHQSLVIDEISMMSASLFECLDFIGKSIRRNQTKPFGGIQLILSGDFLQLPPVPPRTTTLPVEGTKEVRLCFESEVWKTLVKRKIELTTVYRQKDVGFVDFLHRLRTNKLSKEDFVLLHSLARPLTLPVGIEPLKLTPHRKTAVTENMKRLSELSGEEYVFEAVDAGPERDQISPLTNLPERIVLRVGAQVMLLRNFAKFDLVNGSIGVVKCFARPNKDTPILETVKSPTNTPLPVVRFGGGQEFMVGCDKFVLEGKDENTENSTRTQLPLSLAWTCTIHKSQGMTAEFLEVDLSEVFEYGQAYVALSRSRGFDSLRVLGFNALKLKSNPAIIAHFEKSPKENLQVANNSNSPKPKKTKKNPPPVKVDPTQPAITKFFAINTQQR